LSCGVILLGSFPKPLHCFYRILCHAVAFAVANA